MINSQKLRGLYSLGIFDLPVPEFQIAKSQEDIRHLKFGDSEFGWTIRTCLFSGLNENGLFVRNQISQQEIIETLQFRLIHNLNREFYIIYKSWSFIYSFNVLKKDNIYYYEGVSGSQEDISRGRGTPQFIFNIPFGFLTQLNYLTTMPIEFERNFLPQINYYLRKISWDEYSVELALIHDKSLIFYDLRNYKF